jgi:acetyltransferase-like isoleucine patch superfamily enzyme
MEISNTLSKDAIIQDCVIGTGVKVYKNAQIMKSQLDDNSSVGDQAIVIESLLSNNVSINRRNYIFRSKIGMYTYTGLGTMLLSTIIGKFCSLSWNVSIGGGNHIFSNVSSFPQWRFNMLDKGNINHSTNAELQARLQNLGTCTIGNDVWIASNAVILRDVNIGNGAVIGAGAIVTKDVEPYSIVVGNPAKKIRMRFEDKIIEKLEEIQWWNWPIDVIRENMALIYQTEANWDTIQELKKISDGLTSKQPEL